MNERDSVIAGFEKNLLEIKRRHEAGEITSEEAFEEALEEGNRAWLEMPEPKPVEALSATRRSLTGHR